jgi:hypothetical protein
MMRGRRGDHALDSLQTRVGLPEPLEEVGQTAVRRRNVLPYRDLERPQLTRLDAHLLSIGITDTPKRFRHARIKLTMDPAEQIGRADLQVGLVRQPLLEELLHLEMRARLELEGPLSRLAGEVGFERTLDEDGMGVVPLDEVRVVAVHLPQEMDQPLASRRPKDSIERRRLLDDLERETGQAPVSVRRKHRFHLVNLGVHGRTKSNILSQLPISEIVNCTVKTMTWILHF